MSSVGKISANSSSATTLECNSPLTCKKAEEVTRNFLDLLVDCCRDIPVTYRKLSPAVHEAARQELFANLVEKVLGEKNHPYYAIRETMKGPLITELVNSHLLRPKKA